jgi:hypothetical protein
MAININNFYRGTLGPVAFKEVGGRQMMVSKVAPGVIKQTPGTKKSANTFGMASRLGGNLRHIYQHDLNGYYDGGMVSRLNAEINKSLIECRDPESRLFSFSADSFNPLADFDYNSKSLVKDSLKIKPQISIANGLLKVLFPRSGKLPALKFPAGSSDCELIVSVAFIELKEGRKVQVPDRKSLIINKKKQILSPPEFVFEVPDGCLCVVSMFLLYFNIRNNYRVVINNKKFSPAAICGAVITPGAFNENSKRFWIDMISLKFETG